MGGEGDEIDKSDRLVGEFLSKFLIASESNLLDKIDIILLLKAVPIKITLDNISQIKKFKFSILQDAFIAYMNADPVDAFEYYDGKNGNRVQLVKNIEMKKYTNLLNVDSIMKNIHTKVISA